MFMWVGTPMAIIRRRVCGKMYAQQVLTTSGYHPHQRVQNFINW